MHHRPKSSESNVSTKASSTQLRSSQNLTSSNVSVVDLPHPVPQTMFPFAGQYPSSGLWPSSLSTSFVQNPFIHSMMLPSTSGFSQRTGLPFFTGSYPHSAFSSVGHLLETTELKPLSAVPHFENDRDSGNETSSLSPCGSSSPPSSNQSRSNSFSVSNLLKPRIRAESADKIRAEISTNPIRVAPRPPLSLQEVPHNVPYGSSSIAAAAAARLRLYCRDNNAVYEPALFASSPVVSGAPNSPMLLPIPSNREVCVVCEDKASGFHYGVMSCEGCKGFFRRTVQKNMEYSCHKERDCKVDRITRNRCQSCRFEKCLKAGMSKESVRQDRNRKRKAKDETKERELDETRSIMELLKSVVRSYQTSFPSSLKLFDFKDAVTHVNSFIAGIPIFEKICVNDRQKLVSYGVNALLMLRAAFTDDNCAALIGNRSSDIERFRNGIADAIGDEELAILTAICLTQPSCSDLSDECSIDEVATEIVQCLQTQIILRNPSNRHILSKILFKLTDILK